MRYIHKEGLKEGGRVYRGLYLIEFHKINMYLVVPILQCNKRVDGGGHKFRCVLWSAFPPVPTIMNAVPR